MIVFPLSQPTLGDEKVIVQSVLMGTVPIINKVIINGRCPHYMIDFLIKGTVTSLTANTPTIRKA